MGVVEHVGDAKVQQRPTRVTIHGNPLTDKLLPMTKEDNLRLTLMNKEYSDYYKNVLALLSLAVDHYVIRFGLEIIN